MPKVSKGLDALATPKLKGDGQERRCMKQLRPESAEQAMGRARQMPWWPQVVSERPLLIRGLWVWSIWPKREAA